MKKNLFYVAAASALMLTACTSENDILETGPTKQAVPQEVGFDVYTPAATNVTRAGLQGTMTTSRLQRSEQLKGGFGVYAFQVTDVATGKGEGVNATAYASGDGSTPKVPDFMVNQKLLWDTQSMGWYYSPIKYWPNETDNDSQTPAATMEGPTPYSTNENHLDRLTFFAYAPYVSAGQNEVGITGITIKTGKLDPKYNVSPADFDTPKDPSVSYKAELNNPNKVVDLVWGVAPSGGMNYTAVNGTTISKTEGLPLIDMTKPDVNTNMKFLFQHALARIGVTAVAAIDQVSPGGTLDPNTRITIEKITLTGHFGTTGVLNLNNKQASHEHANVANWTHIDGTAITTSTPVTALTTTTTLTLEKPYIAEHLRYVPDAGEPATHQAQANRVGVTTVRQNVIAPSAPSTETGYSTFWSSSKTYTEAVPYSESTPFYTTEACTTKAQADITAATSPAKMYTINSLGVYTLDESTTKLTYPEVNQFYYATFKKVKADGSETDTEIAAASVTDKQAYKYDSSAKTFTPLTVGKAPEANATADPTKDEYVIVGEVTKATAIYAADTYWTRDANYFMVVPTDNILYYNNLDKDQKDELHKVTVMIEYYITTEDAALNAERTQTKNVVVKDVVFPSIANGKSYNLNLVLGLTSVKMEAEVDDWKFVNVQGDLPQNTAGE